MEAAKCQNLQMAFNKLTNKWKMSEVFKDLMSYYKHPRHFPPDSLALTFSTHDIDPKSTHKLYDLTETFTHCHELSRSLTALLTILIFHTSAVVARSHVVRS